MALELHKIPVISTAHIDLATNNRLDHDGGPWCPCAAYHDVGYFLFLDDLEASDEEVPQCLTAIRDWLRKLRAEGVVDDCCWVRLDCDAETVEELPTYDW